MLGLSDPAFLASIRPANSAPVITVPGAQSIVAGIATAITGISIADAETNPQAVTISVSQGTFTLASLTGLTFTVGDGTADASMAFSGSLANVNAAIATITYTGAILYSGSDTVIVNTNDGTVSATQKTVTITVTDFALSLSPRFLYEARSGVYSDAGSTPATATNKFQQWNDLVAGGNYASQTTSGLQATYDVVSGKPVVRTTTGGVSHAYTFLSTVSIPAIGVPYTFIAVVKGTTSSVSVVMHDSVHNRQYNIGQSANNKIGSYDGGSNNPASDAFSVDLTNWTVCGWRGPGNPSANVINFYEGITQRGTGTFSFVSSPSNMDRLLAYSGDATDIVLLGAFPGLSDPDWAKLVDYANALHP